MGKFHRSDSDIRIALAHRSGGKVKMEKIAQQRYLDVTPKYEGSTDADDTMLSPSRADKMNKTLPSDLAGEVDVLRGRTRPRMRVNPNWVQQVIKDRNIQMDPRSYEMLMQRLRGRPIGQGQDQRHVQDFRSPFVIGEDGKVTKVRRFQPKGKEQLTDAGMGVLQGNQYSWMQGQQIPPEMMGEMEKGWQQDSEKRKSDLKSLVERWNKNVPDFSQSLMEGGQRGLYLMQFFNNSRAAILGGHGSMDEANMAAEKAFQGRSPQGMDDIAGVSLIAIINNRVNKLNDQLARFSEEQEALDPLYKMQEEDFSSLLDQMRSEKPSQVTPEWADLMSILHRGKMMEQDPIEGVQVPDSWDKIRGAYEETRGKGGGRPRTPFTGRELLKRDPIGTIGADEDSAMDIKDFFRDLDTSQGYGYEGKQGVTGLLRSQAKQKIAGVADELRGLLVIRDSLGEVVNIENALLESGATDEAVRSQPELLRTLDMAMLHMLNAAAVTYKDPERFIAKGDAATEGAGAAQRLNQSYNVDDESKMLILTKLMYLAKTWDLFRGTMEVGSYDEVMQGGDLPVEQDYEETAKAVGERPLPGMNVDLSDEPDVQAAVSGKFARFAAIADAKGFYRIADHLDLISAS